LAIVLEIKSGPSAGKKLPLLGGQSVLVGRAPDRAQFAIPHDSHMSGVHFAVECAASGCRVIDKKSTNGTFLNGARIQEAMLASGDEIKSGQTVFVVRIVPDDQLPTASPIAQTASPGQPVSSKQSPAFVPSPVASGPAYASPRSAVAPPAPSPVPERSYKPPEQPAPFPAGQGGHAPWPAPASAVPKLQPSVSPQSRSGRLPALAIGSWVFARIPEGWKIQEGLGIQLDAKDEKVFSSNIGAMEEPMGPGITLSEYVEAQTKMFREYLREPKIDAALPPKIPGATETIALEVRFSTKDGLTIYYRRVYARGRSAIGVLTLTTLEKDLSSVRPAYDSFLAGASFSAQS
jgi:hypothetical protein